MDSWLMEPLMGTPVAPRGGGGATGAGVAARLGGEPVEGRGVVDLAGPEHGGWEVGVVRRVRVVLGLEREPVTLAVHPAARADQRAVQEVAGVELDPRLGGGDGQGP